MSDSHSVALDHLLLGQKAQVHSIAGHPQIVERLYELGFYAGAPVEVMAQAPWGGPSLVLVGHSVVALRSSEAQCVHVNLRGQ